MTEQNPYATPTYTEPKSEFVPINLDPKDRKKAEAVIKDAGQFWLAIVLCFVCSAIGALIVPIWYLIRLLQWHSLAGKYPELLAEGVPSSSIQAKFKSSQWKLIVGMAVGAVMFAGVGLYFVLLILGGLAAA